jgi:TRAP-type mannitol/chloroaromatic compound transport system substrate-binding protein
MDRRQFVAGAGIGAGAAAAASAFPRPAIAQGMRELKMVTIWPKTLPGLQTGAERVAAAITSLSGGQLNVKVFAAGQLVGAFESFEAVSSGLADIYHASEITWAGRSPAFSYFCNVPFGFTPPELNAWIYSGGGQALWDELSASFGLKPFMCGNTGPQMGGWFTKELTGVESWDGFGPTERRVIEAAAAAENALHTRISPPTTPSRFSSSPMIRRSRSVSSTIRSCDARPIHRLDSIH